MSSSSMEATEFFLFDKREEDDFAEEDISRKRISFLCSSVCWGQLTERVHRRFVLSDTTPHIWPIRLFFCSAYC
jgi:hypothetical protein